MQRMRMLLCLVVWTTFIYGHPGSAQLTSAFTLDRYAACSIPDGPAVVETAPLSPGVHVRSVDTLHGHKMIEMEEGKPIMFAYPDENFYANMKAERLPVASFADAKKTLIDNFDQILASSPDNSRNYALKPKLNGFEIYGLDRGKLEGGVLGVYLFFNDVRHEVVTIYFLNQEPKKRFQTIAEYARLRNNFLESYTSCLAKE